MNPLIVVFGAVVGLSLGLTGGGGAIFAVPLMVYGLQLAPRDAVAVSLAAVGTTSLVGFLHRAVLREVELKTGLLFALAGMVGAPVGTWLAGLIPATTLLIAFAALMMIVAIRLWQQSTRPLQPLTDCPVVDRDQGPTCQRDAEGKLLLTSRCACLLLAVGVLTGILSGLFGVGGGFIIVPALVLFSGMSIHRAVGTSLMVVALVSVSGIASQWSAGHQPPLDITLPFVMGGIGGLFAGQRLGRRLSGPRLQRTFAVAIVGVALFVVFRSLSS